MPAPAPGLGELLSQIATGIHYALHPVSTLLGRLGATGRGLEDLDTALYALIAWLLGSREAEALRKLGLVAAAGLLALALVEIVILTG